MKDSNCRRTRVIDSHIKGAAFVKADAEFLLDPQDPFCMGIRA
jgi:proline racemase